MSSYTVRTYPPLEQPRADFDDPAFTADLIAAMSAIKPMPGDDRKVYATTRSYRVYVRDVAQRGELETRCLLEHLRAAGIPGPTVGQLRYIAALWVGHPVDDVRLVQLKPTEKVEAEAPPMRQRDPYATGG